MVPERITLYRGKHKSDGRTRAGCVMEWVTVKWLVGHGSGLAAAWDALTDAPLCTDPVVRQAAWIVNDALPDPERQRLVPFIDRLMRCETPSDPQTRKRVRLRVACWATRSVLDLISGDNCRAIALHAVETVEAWLCGEATLRDCAAASAQAAIFTEYANGFTTETAPAAAWATAYAAAHTPDAARATSAITAAVRAAARSERALVFWLDDLITQWEKARAEEGCAADAGFEPAASAV
jgi:hypothetical protein